MMLQRHLLLGRAAPELGGISPTRSVRRVAVRKPIARVHAQYDRSAREQYLEEVRRLIDKAEYTSRTQQDGLTKVLIGASLPLLKLIANAPAPDAAPRAPPREDYSRDEWRRSSNGNSSWGSSSSEGSSSGGYTEQPYQSSSFGSGSGFGGSTFGRDRAPPAPARNPREDNPQLSATFKLLRAVGIGFAVSLFFGTIPFLDLLQLPEKGGALGWAVYTAAYLWAMLALLRFGKLNMDQPFSVLPDNSELAAESLRGNTPGMATFAMLNAAADGILYRGALLTSVAVWGDLLILLPPHSNMTSPTTIILLTAAVETAVRVLTVRNDRPPDLVVSGVFHFVLVAFLASETLSTGSLLGSIGTQALGLGLAATAARQGWMEIPDMPADSLRR